MYLTGMKSMTGISITLNKNSCRFKIREFDIYEGLYYDTSTGIGKF